MKKRAVFFSIDALIALIVIFLTILAVYPTMRYAKQESVLEEDILKVLSSLKAGEINNSDFQVSIANGNIKDLNKSILEQIGEFYITNPALAINLSESFLSTIDTSENIGIWYGGTLLASKNTTSYESAKSIETAKQIISGIREGEGVTGYAARAWLSSSLQKKYFYFGGYVGEGNLTSRVEYYGNISSAELELAINNNFNVYINGVLSGSYSKSDSDFQPKNYSLPINNFISGVNLVELKGENLHVAGGFVKIAYESNVPYEPPIRHYFPGIDGIINLYDGFYIPGQLNTLYISLHLNSNYVAFLTIGNTTVFENATNGEETITLTNSQLSPLLEYGSLSQKTIPFRLGLENVSYVTNITTTSDVFSVMDISGSMCGTCTNVTCGRFDCCGPSCLLCYLNEAKCENCNGTCTGGINEAKIANKVFIDSILNFTGNRVGLVGYNTNAPDEYYHSLSTDNFSLKSKVDSWNASDTTCICCGINKSTNSLLNESSEDKFRSMVIMSDGEANVRCYNANTDLNNDGSVNAKDDAIKMACDAYNNYDIKVYAIGFGPSADENTLQLIASCGNGSYYYGTADNIIEIYNRIAQEILEAAYREQTVEIIGSGSISTKLYPDSYIEFGYPQEEIPYGLITTSEKNFSDEYSGSFSLPSNSRILETTAISYSGARWTDKVEINNTPVYSLSSYGSDYTKLGDPYAINIPNSLIQQDNTVRLTTGVSPTNTTYGSQYNKIIYTTIRNMTSYSGIAGFIKGCKWNIEFEDGSSAQNLTIPSGYPGANICDYTSSNHDLDDIIQLDAINLAVYNLLKILDFDLNGKLDVKFTEQDLQISSSEIIGIPYVWSTEVQIRKWY